MAKQRDAASDDAFMCISLTVIVVLLYLVAVSF